MAFDQNLFMVYFFYGLSFFGMGLAMIMESWRVTTGREVRVLLPLAGFGLIHAAHEWLEAFLMQSEAMGKIMPIWLEWLPLALLVSSYLSLLLFAMQALKLVGSPVPRQLVLARGFVAVYFVFVAGSILFSRQTGSFGEEELEGLTRYLLAVPSSLLAAFGLHFFGINSRTRSAALERQLNQAAIGFGLYAATHLIVSRMHIFPANILNKDTFRAFAGFPIEIVWTLVAIWITYSLLLYVKRSEDVRQADILSAQKERLEALEAQQALRRELLMHTVRAQEDERARIARELHDETAQTLSAFTLELASLHNDKLRKPDIKRAVEHLQELSADMSRGIYRMVYDLRPSQLDDLGLVPALRFLCEQKCKEARLNLKFETSGSPRRLSKLLETALFRVGQEALKNLALHSQVQEGRVEVVYAENEVILRVIDRGRGFDPAENFHPPHGWGLAGMKERVESIGGVLHIISAPSAGTTIEARVPLAIKEFVK
jgi:signal transduction histidine kinase